MGDTVSRSNNTRKTCGSGIVFSGSVQRLFSLVLLKVTCETMFGMCNNSPNDPFILFYKVCNLYSIATDLCYFGRKGQSYAFGILKAQGTSLWTLHFEASSNTLNFKAISLCFVFSKNCNPCLLSIIIIL